MKLHLQRTERGDRYTMGRLTIDGVAFCDTLEPTDRHLEAATMRQLMKTLTNRPRDEELQLTVN